jgi:hypothetical protein
LTGAADASEVDAVVAAVLVVADAVVVPVVVADADAVVVVVEVFGCSLKRL